jgi:hypothetical protein
MSNKNEIKVLELEKKNVFMSVADALYEMDNNIDNEYEKPFNEISEPLGILESLAGKSPSDIREVFNMGICKILLGTQYFRAKEYVKNNQLYVIKLMNKGIPVLLISCDDVVLD